MTREERENALHCLKVMIDEEVCEECKLYGTTGTDHCEKDCVRLAIEALEQEPDTWSLDDAREDFMSDVYDTLDFLPTNKECNEIIDSFDRVTSGIKKESKTGYWIDTGSSQECSECREIQYGYDNFRHFCANCGAKMVEPPESEV